jgi:hypothetical protein
MWQGELISVGGPSKDNKEIRKEWNTQQKKRERANNLVMFNGIEHRHVKETVRFLSLFYLSSLLG